MPEILKEGVLLDQGNKKVPYNIVTLDKSWQDSLMAVQEEVYRQIADKALYIKLSPQEFKEVLGDMGIAVGTIVNDRLVGFHVSSFFDEETKELGKLINLSEKELVQLAYIEASVVLPQYRGNGLQKKMIKENINLLKNTGQLKYLVSTISPQNLPSLNSLLKLHFAVIATKELAPGCVRNILYREL